MSEEKSYAQVLAERAIQNHVQNLIEQSNNDYDSNEYDYEGDMAMSQLKSIITNAQRLHDMLEEDTNLPEWVQSKITLAEDYILSATNYMEGEMNEEVEQVDEARYQVVGKTKENETFKSKIYPTKKEALGTHYKMSKSGRFKNINTVKVAEELDRPVYPGDSIREINGGLGEVKEIVKKGNETWIRYLDQHGKLNFGIWNKHLFPVNTQNNPTIYEEEKLLDPVGKEDEDINNDGKKMSATDQYLLNRRRAIAKQMSK